MDLKDELMEYNPYNEQVKRYKEVKKSQVIDLGFYFGCGGRI